MSLGHTITLFAAAVLSVAAITTPAGAQQSAPSDHPMMPRDLEIELALSAAPKHLRAGATVLVLDANGYIRAREGTNAFTCIVNRKGGDIFPVCWDAEGAKSVLPVDVEAVQLRLSGRTNAEIERVVADGYKSGRYHAPSRAGVAYMLSPLRYRIDEQGHATRSNANPHIMFYGPGLTDADVGGVRGSSPVYMNKVGPDGMIIVPVGVKEREAILEESQPLVEGVERLIAPKQP